MKGYPSDHIDDLAGLVAEYRLAQGAADGWCRVRLPWWKALLRRRRYELRPVSPMAKLVVRESIGAGAETWNEAKIERLADV